METKVNNTFFSKNGLTSTSANHIANLAKEYADSLKQELDNISFLNESITWIGGNKSLPVREGVTDLSFEDKLYTIGKCYSLIAWLREAIKKREKLTEKVNNMTLSNYLLENDIVLVEPIKPIKSTPVTQEDIIDTLGSDERRKLLWLESYVSVYGKFIHPNGALNKAKKELAKHKNGKYSINNSGSDTIVTEYTPSVEIKNVEEVFFRLQNKYRDMQATYNSMIYEIENKVNTINRNQELARIQCPNRHLQL